ncbi:alpha/beta fold hydrolase [Rhodohalobacter sp. 8-1]|uniref:alpha/beta fold hydrolase n=1 Tax=Rhodohalobacter sp. 8-1 TaxID=3131972 RepID=UPI0030ED7C67
MLTSIRKITLWIILLIFGIVTVQAQENKTIYVEKYGQGPAAILLPGLMSSGDLFDGMLSYLSEYYECHVVTFAGYAGKPAITADRYLPEFQKAVEEYIDEKNLGDVTLLGHSLGGFLSLKIASEKNVGVREVIVLDALPFLAGTMNPNAPEGFNEARAKMYLNSTKGQDEESMREMRLMSLQSMIDSDEHREEIVKWAINSDLKTEAWTAMEMMGTDLRDDISSIEAPVLVLAAYGGKNPAMPSITRESVWDTYSEQYRELRNLTLKVAEKAKHFIMYDDPEWVKKEIMAFIDRSS